MESIDKMTMVHIAGEVIVIGGLTFWMNKRISGLQEEIAELRQQIEQQNQLLSQHEMIFRQMFNGQKSRNLPPPVEPDISTEDLDSALGDELNNIQKERSKEDCEEECELKERPKRRKKKRNGRSDSN